MIIKLLDVIKDAAKIALLVKSMGPPLITLMSHPVRSNPPFRKEDPREVPFGPRRKLG